MQWALFPFASTFIVVDGNFEVSGNKKKHVFPKTRLKTQNISNSRM